ncbi:MAG TPA: type II toxin-antitoxin system VapB family antitoxin [Victivallales bacterium]|nr:type II toxin-antitoxin system VapB family antitoxin [Victivallales bacterium]
MRTTLELDDKLIATAMKITGIKSKTKLLNKCLKDEIMEYKKKMLLSLRNSGSIDEDYDVASLRGLELNEQ